MSIQLRKYQEDSVNTILQEFTRTESILFQMPTGTGKTTIFSEIIKVWSTKLHPNKRILILVHRKELVSQIIDRLKQFGILAGRIQSGYLNNILLQVQVGLIQSLSNPARLPNNLSLIIIDEAHHTPSKSYRNILKHYSQSSPYILGVTATPYRLSGESFSELFDKLILSKSIKEFIQEGWLTPIKHLATSFNDFSNVRIKNKEYVEKDLEIILRSEKVMVELIESYFKYGDNKKAIIFALNKSHSKDIVERFKLEKINAEFIDSDTPSDLRDEIVNKFKNGEIKILCNVNIFTEGFDCPDVELVLLARPTKSFSLYLQQVGRVMRTNEGKTHGLILDNASLWLEHGLVTQEVKWSLNGKLTKSSTVPKVMKNNKPVSIEGMLPTEIFGLELIELQDEKETSEVIIEDISLENIDNNNIEPIYPKFKEDIRIINLAIKLNITTTEIINQLNRLYKIAKG
jgi:superfamily II DNA or RNA helicase